MKACLIEAKGKVSIVDVPHPGRPQKDEVLVRIQSAGICGSDMHIYHGSSAFAIYPNIMGHELAGEIDEVGADVTNLTRGDRVAINNVLSCGECYACKSGRPNVCRDVKVLGVHTEGGFQEFLKIPARNAFRFPEKLPYEYAALIEPYSIAAESLQRGRICDGDRVLICGAGPIGLMLLQAAKLYDVKIAVMDVIASRLKLALELGADWVIDPLKEDAVEKVMEVTDGEGMSLIFEATGNLKIFEQAISQFPSAAARVVVLGFSSEKAEIAPIEIMKRGLDILGSRLNNNRFPEAIDWLSKGKIDPSKLISSVKPIEEAAEVMEYISHNLEKVIKVVLRF